jgi:hypothetical protein
MRTLLGLWTICAVALADEPSREKIPAELRGCVAIERNTERLACFDRGIAAILRADGVAPSTESSFGLVASTPQGGSGDTRELRSIRRRVATIQPSAGGELITLDNGQTWRQLSGGALLLKVGDEVEITRAALGSFQISVPSGRTAKVKRIS